MNENFKSNNQKIFLMKNLVLLLFILTLGNNCKKECEPAVPFLALRFANYYDSSNYVFGNQKQVDYNKLKFYSIVANDTFNIKTMKEKSYAPMNNEDSLITMVLSQQNNKKIFIRYPFNKIDSLEITYDIYTCGSNVGRVWLNKQEIYTGNINFFSIYK